jgi:RES domain-containing protein
VDIASLVRHVAHDRTVRLVSTARLRAPVLAKLVPASDLDALAEIEGATSGRLRAQESGTDTLDRRELVFGFPHAHFINAAFSYAFPRSLNRFNGPGRGAWYAALIVETCVAEVAFHMERELANVGDYDTAVEYAEMFASFVGDFVDITGVSPPPDCLHPDPAKGYPAGNLLADAVRGAGHYGIVYPSVRAAGGVCLVALVPHAVQSVAQGRVLRLTWRGKPGPQIEVLG